METETADKVGRMIPTSFGSQCPTELMSGHPIYDYYIWRRVCGDIESLNGISDPDTFEDRIREIVIEYLILGVRIVDGDVSSSSLMKHEEYRILIDTLGIFDVVEELRLEMGE